MLAAMLCLIALLPAACGDAPPAPLRVGVHPWVGYEPLVLARERRFLDSARIQVIELGSHSENRRNLRNGLLDMAALTLGEALELIDDGLPLRIVAVLGYSRGGDALLSRQELGTLADLRGRRIALEPNSVSERLLARALEAGGLAAEDVQTVHIEATMHEAALRLGQADALITFEPIKQRLMREGHRVLFDSTRMPGEIIDVLAMRADALPEHRDELVELLAAWERARDEFEARPQAAAEILAPGVDLDPKRYVLAATGAHSVKLAAGIAMLEGNPAPLAVEAALQVAHLQQLGVIRSPPDWDAILAPQAGRRALAAPETAP